MSLWLGSCPLSGSFTSIARRWAACAIQSKNSPNQSWRNESFRGYADDTHMAPFLGRLMLQSSRIARVAILGAEAGPWRCHRSLVADALLIRQIPAVEILFETSWRLRQLTPFARIERTRITYPPPEP